MSELRELQQGFMSYLLAGAGAGKGHSIVQHIESTPSMSASQRLGIYANAYQMRLQEALATDYEMLHAYLGDEQFYSLCERYIAEHPSQVTSLRYFSLALPQMLQDQEPFNGLPQLHELALIEQSFANSFDAADAEVATLEQLVNLDPEYWPNLRLEFTASQQLLELNTNSFDIWKALTEETSPPEVELYEEPQVWSVWRKADLVSHYRPLSPAERAVLTTAAEGGDFSAICETLLAFYDDSEVPQQAVGFLQSWLAEERVTVLICESQG